MQPLSERRNKLRIEEIAVLPDSTPPDIAGRERDQIGKCAERMRAARKNGRPIMLTYGAHLIKNGLGPILAHMVETGWLTHLATNGAGSIHDWEFAFQGMSAEDVRENTALGRFGTWEETGRFINLAVSVGGAERLGYGASVGRFIHDAGLSLPSPDELRAQIAEGLSDRGADLEMLAARADLLAIMERHSLKPGKHDVPHPWKRFSVQWAAYRRGVPLTIHPGIGYDIIYTHPMASGGPIGRGAMRDFLTYAEGVSRLTGGVHIVVGSSVMAPMIFEKALSMANNIAINSGQPTVHDHYLVVVDIQDGGHWDWSHGEPPMDNPAYYLRFCKTFYRMGGTLDYICMDNAAFLPTLLHELVSL
jgi:hypothetical protein